MKAGNFNINDYLQKLYEDALPMMDGGEGLTNADGIIIPDENKKSYDWLKKEYQKGQTEVKVEINMGDAKFDPGYDMQTNLDSVKDFKPGMYGEAKPANASKDGIQKPGEQTPDNKSQKPSLDPKKDSATFTKGEGEKEKTGETNGKKADINKKPSTASTKKPDTEKKKEGEETDEDDEKKEKKPSDDDTKVKKIDLKTKK